MATLPSISYTIGEYFVQNQMSLLIYLPVKTRYVYKERVFTYENKRYEKSIDADTYYYLHYTRREVSRRAREVIMSARVVSWCSLSRDGEGLPETLVQAPPSTR